MKAFRVTAPKQLEQVDLPDPGPRRGEVVLKVHANCLNFRDTIVLKGGYPRNDNLPCIALSDAACEIVEVGDGVDGWNVGDRVMPNFLRDWIAGAPDEAILHSAFGGGIDGLLAERVAVPAHCLVRIPEHLSYEEAATLPCAALTAWHALTTANTTAGDSVLLLGTGGVSIFGLQLAKAMGATTLITSSSDEKLEEAKSLGADHTINYADTPAWHEPVREFTNGRGVDNVLEVGGAGTLERSLQAAAVGGTISLIGLLTNPDEQPSILPTLLNVQTIRGIYVGSVEMFRAMNRAISAHKLRPVIDKTFGFDDAAAAYAYLAEQKHVGKVVITQG